MNNEKIVNIELQAKQALQNKNYPLAHRHLLNILKSSPKYAQAFYLLAQIPLAHNNEVKAIELLERAVLLSPSEARYPLLIAKIYSQQSQPEQTQFWLQKVSINDLKSAFDCDTLGVIYSQLGLHEQACNAFSQAISLNNQHANFHYNLASSHKYLGQFNEAKVAYEQAISLEPCHYQAHTALTHLGNISKENNHIERLSALLADVLNSEDRLYIAHALADEFIAVGDYPQAMTLLQQVKENRIKALNYTPESDLKMFAALKTVFSQPQQNVSKGHDNNQAIFVVGMPRTGTTLVERIFTNHPQVKSAGELHHFEMLLKKSGGLNWQKLQNKSHIAAAANVDFSTLGKDYIRSITLKLDKTEKFVDKLPLNILFAGYIIRALPQCKIICLDRGAHDTVLSNYRQIFSPSYRYCDYALSLESTALFYLEFKKLAEFWQTMFPDNFMLVNYEKLVNNPIDEARKMLSFCQLSWRDSFVEIENNLSPVATASAVQVRQPITNTNVGNWKKFAEYLKPIEHILADDESLPLPRLIKGYIDDL